MKLTERGKRGLKIHQEISVREPEVTDGFTDGEDPSIPVSPDNYIPLIDDINLANYSDTPFKVTLQIVNGKKLIGIHDV